MKDIEICVPIITTILGIAYPIILQVISQLESKYKTPKILSLFEGEYIYKLFRWLLYSSLLSTLFYILGGYSLALKNSYYIQEYINTIVLIIIVCSVISFILLINKVILYLSTKKLIDYLFKKKNKEGIYNSEILESLTDIFCWAIKNEEESITKILNDNIYKLFSDFRQNKPNNPQGYPDEYYSLFYKVSRETVFSDSKRLKNIEIYTTGGVFLLGEYVNNTIAPRTYQYLWYNLMFCVKNDKDDCILTYWKNVFQYFQYSLAKINPEYSEDYSLTKNEDTIIKREQERKKFLEFHYAFGGLLYYKSKLKCIKRIFDFTNQEPPEYVLFPQTMTELFKWYMHFSDNLYNWNLSIISMFYPFPDTEGIKADGIIRRSICRYITLLFLRQYTLVRYYTHQQHTELPHLPEEIKECNIWLDNIDLFTNDVNFILSKKDIMQNLGFEYYGYISDEWCDMQEKEKPLNLLRSTKDNLKAKIDSSKSEQELSLSKVKEFRDKSKNILNEFIQEIKVVSNTNEWSSNYNSLQLRGQKHFFDRFAFCDDTDISFVEADSILAEALSINLKRSYSAFFFSNKKTSYTLTPKDVFSAIDKLNISTNYVLIAFGVYFEYYINTLKISDLQKKGNKYSYKNIDVITYNTSESWVSNSIFIIRKDELPSLHFNDIPKENKEKYNLSTEIDKEHHIYADIIDYQNNSELKMILTKENNDPNKNLSQCVLAIIDLFIELRWNKNAEMVQIQINSGYEQRGLINKIEEIKPLKSSK